MRRLAIVDDAPDMADFLAFLLRGGDREIFTFTAAKEFVSQFVAGSFDLIVLDLAMPDWHGMDLFRWIREKDGSVPVVAVTAQNPATEKKKAIQAGFANFYAKPIADPDAFRQDIDRYMSRQTDRQTE
jgi:two-component system CheB/CheR fusion protein